MSHDRINYRVAIHVTSVNLGILVHVCRIQLDPDSCYCMCSATFTSGLYCVLWIPKRTTLETRKRGQLELLIGFLRLGHLALCRAWQTWYILVVMFLESTQAFIFHSIPCSNVGCYSNGQNLIRREHIVKIADASCHTPLSSRCRRKRHLRVSSTDERTDSWRAIRYHSAYPLAERRRRREEPLNMAERGVGGADEPAAVSGVVVDVVVEQGACVSVKDSFLTVDDPFEELEDRPRYRCVVHDNTSKPPKPYNKGWEWQKQASMMDSSEKRHRRSALLIAVYDYLYHATTG